MIQPLFKTPGIFQHMLKMLHLPRAHELGLASTNVSPGCTVSTMIQELATEVENPELRCLIFGHYAGHVTAGPSNDLVFYASKLALRTMAMNLSFMALCDIDHEPFRNTDVVLILHSCFAGMATRGTDSHSHRVEITASVLHDQAALGNFSDLARI